LGLTYLTRPDNQKYAGRTIADVADMMGLPVVDALCELLLAEDLQVCVVAGTANPNTLPKFISHPLSMVGSDALLLGDFPSPRTYGCFAVILGEYVREEKYLALPDAVRKMTGFPAHRLGLPDRGLLRDGLKADIVVFDPGRVKSPATRRNPKQFPVGIEYVLVNGKVVVERGKHTGVLAGRALRRGRAAT
jgi:N-acyl-D-amino-acid deacylase